MSACIQQGRTYFKPKSKTLSKNRCIIHVSRGRVKFLLSKFLYCDTAFPLYLQNIDSKYRKLCTLYSNSIPCLFFFGHYMNHEWTDQTRNCSLTLTFQFKWMLANDPHLKKYLVWFKPITNHLYSPADSLQYINWCLSFFHMEWIWIGAH